MSFQKDLELGEIGEKAFVELLASYGIETEKNNSSTLKELRSHDYKDKKWGFSYEVKWDIASSKTGNVYFEDKAIKNSKADFLVHILGKECYKMPMVQARKLLASKRYRVVMGGDFKDRGVLIPIEEYKWLGSFVGFILNTEMLEQNIRESAITLSSKPSMRDI